MDEDHLLSLVRRGGGGATWIFWCNLENGLMLNHRRPKGLTLNYLGGNGLTLNYLERMV